MPTPEEILAARRKKNATAPAVSTITGQQGINRQAAGLGTEAENLAAFEQDLASKGTTFTDPENLAASFADAQKKAQEAATPIESAVTAVEKGVSAADQLAAQATQTATQDRERQAAAGAEATKDVLGFETGQTPTTTADFIQQQATENLRSQAFADAQKARTEELEGLGLTKASKAVAGQTAAAQQAFTKGVGAQATATQALPGQFSAAGERVLETARLQITDARTRRQELEIRRKKAVEANNRQLIKSIDREIESQKTKELTAQANAEASLTQVLSEEKTKEQELADNKLDTLLGLDASVLSTMTPEALGAAFSAAGFDPLLGGSVILAAQKAAEAAKGKDEVAIAQANANLEKTIAEIGQVGVIKPTAAIQDLQFLNQLEASGADKGLIDAFKARAGISEKIEQPRKSKFASSGSSIGSQIDPKSVYNNVSFNNDIKVRPSDAGVLQNKDGDVIARITAEFGANHSDVSGESFHAGEDLRFNGGKVVNLSEGRSQIVKVGVDPSFGGFIQVASNEGIAQYSHQSLEKIKQLRNQLKDGDIFIESGEVFSSEEVDINKMGSSTGQHTDFRILDTVDAGIGGVSERLNNLANRFATGKITRADLKNQGFGEEDIDAIDIASQTVIQDKQDRGILNVEDLSPIAKAVVHGTADMKDLTPTQRGEIIPELDQFGYKDLVLKEDKKGVEDIIKGLDDLLGLLDEVPGAAKGLLKIPESPLFKLTREFTGLPTVKEASPEVASFESARAIVGMQLTRLFEKGRISDADRIFYMEQMPNRNQSSQNDNAVPKASVKELKRLLNEKIRENDKDFTRFMETGATETSLSTEDPTPPIGTERTPAQQAAIDATKKKNDQAGNNIDLLKQQGLIQ